MKRRVILVAVLALNFGCISFPIQEASLEEAVPTGGGEVEFTNTRAFSICRIDFSFSDSKALPKEVMFSKLHPGERKKYPVSFSNQQRNGSVTLNMYKCGESLSEPFMTMPYDFGATKVTI